MARVIKQKMRTIKISLNPSDLAALESKAKLHRCSLSEETRRRLESSIVEDRLDLRARRWGYEVSQLANFILRSLSEGNAVEVDEEVFDAALCESLKAWLKMRVKTENMKSAKKSSADPKTLGHAAAHHLFMIQHER
jgi:hypothetical protein